MSFFLPWVPRARRATSQKINLYFKTNRLQIPSSRKRIDSTERTPSECLGREGLLTFIYRGIYRGVHEALHTAMISDEVTIIGYFGRLCSGEMNSVRRILSINLIGYQPALKTDGGWQRSC